VLLDVGGTDRGPPWSQRRWRDDGPAYDRGAAAPLVAARLRRNTTAGRKMLRRAWDERTPTITAVDGTADGEACGPEGCAV
jgi:hypothetical protein